MIADSFEVCFDCIVEVLCEVDEVSVSDGMEERINCCLAEFDKLCPCFREKYLLDGLVINLIAMQEVSEVDEFIVDSSDIFVVQLKRLLLPRRNVKPPV